MALQYRNVIEVKALLQATESIVSSELDPLSAYHKIHEERDEYAISPPHLLNFKLSALGPPAIQKAKDPRKSEFLATLALALIGEAHAAEKADYTIFGLSANDAVAYNQSLISNLIEEANIAIDIAEKAIYEEAYSREFKAERARRGGLAKHESAKALMVLAVEVYHAKYANRSLSKAEAGRRVWQQIKQHNFDASGHPILKGQHPEGTIAKWIRSDLKALQQTS